MCSVRLNDEEQNQLRSAAQAVGASLPAFLARAGMAAAADPETAAAVIAGRRELIAELFSARRHLAHIGNNLNQVARAINAGGRPSDVDAVIAQVHRAAQRVDEAIAQILDRT